ncbi:MULTISPECIES: helix-turn-helix domain-containing protein [Paraburkholderia]|uniref:helix-turn-helix domain-containing protein n=1 Tax=Paraburkholderia TaxID=1822464 RepID=UPI00225B1C8B|nr:MULTISPECIES: helix-turn-helix transcriptional regulator [Paraburkholderia]MCX4162776.1 helix-turn-helix transcriptional regulator [Paraburkholderia megapolitana]MDN7158271.1 helix-turn-helix domain-containing protein [Paraburkholderia sp. CHISQ3]MDQ6495318.1 helix-turn-helix domain-containing protein [Paraburkholderia megapolitana]
MAPSAEKKLARQIGDALARERARRGYTQEQVADRLDVTVETISRFERGAVLPTLTRLVELANVYAVSVSDLLRRGSTRPTDVAEELAHVLSLLTDADRVFVREWVTQLCERLQAAPLASSPRKLRTR